METTQLGSKGNWRILGVEMPHSGCQKQCEQTIKCVYPFQSNTSSWQTPEISPFSLSPIVLSDQSEFSRTPIKACPYLLKPAVVFRAVRKGQMASPVLLTDAERLVQGGHGFGARLRDGGSDLPLVHPGTVFCDLCLTQ